jgi:short-subunit dehydrogenase
MRTAWVGAEVRPYVFAGGTAVLTGAASGIGRALAGQLAGLGSHLALVDRDEAGLDTLSGQLRTSFPALNISTHVYDLSDLNGIPALTERVQAAHPRVTLLINNAGVALGGAFEQLSAADFDWLMTINFSAPVALTRALLPALRSGLGAHIVNVSSLFGLIGPAGQSAYSASKFALRGFSEVLRHELSPHGLGVSVVHPGGVKTNIATNARMGSGVGAQEAEQGARDFERLLTLDPGEAARLILRGTERRAPRIVVGRDAQALDVIARLLPGHYWTLVQRLTARTP